MTASAISSCVPEPQALWATLGVATSAALRIGYRVPRKRFDGIVHAAFAPACYVDCGDLLLTVATSAVADGPTVLVLDAGADADLRRLFRRGDAVRCRDRWLRTRRAAIDLRDAPTWHAPAARPPLLRCQQRLRADDARARLALARCGRASVLVRDAEPAIARLVDACRRFDAAGAYGEAARFVGWGEGLTPAGDDFLVGLFAALHALRGDDAQRVAFVERLASSIAARRSRTTPIAAHALVLAALGHFGGDVLAVLDALRSEPDPRRAGRTLDRVLLVGATSGADLLTGVLAALSAWPEDARADLCPPTSPIPACEESLR